MDFQILARRDVSHSFLSNHHGARFASCWTVYCLLTTCASSRSRINQRQNTHPCCEVREYTLGKISRDAPSSRNAWFFSHGFGTYRLESLHFGSNLPIADTCQSWQMLKEDLEWLSHIRCWSLVVTYLQSQLLSTSFYRLGTLSYCSSKNRKGK